MKKEIGYIIISVLLLLMFSCSEKHMKAPQPEPPNVTETIESAWGTSYANLVTEFFEVLKQEQQPSYQRGSKDQHSQGQQASYNRGTQKPDSRKEKLAVHIDVLKAVYRDGKIASESIKNGDTLTHQDNYKIQFSSNLSCYVYIAQLDAKGKLQPIVPSDFVHLDNPVKPNTLYSIPDSENWFFLDENSGKEHLYFIISRTQRHDIGSLFWVITRENKDLKQKAPITVNQDLSTKRGIAGVREGQKQKITFKDGTQELYDSTLFESFQADFALTRWFYHK